MHPRSALLLAPAHLSSCVFAAILRDTRGGALGDAARFNHFPASPLVSLTYVIAGSLHMVPTGGSLAQARAAPALPPLSVTPPQQGPVTSWSPGPVAVVTVGFYPEAWRVLEQGGATQGILRGLETAFGGLRQGDDFAPFWSEFADNTGSNWHKARRAGGLADWAGSARLADWSRALVARAAVAGPGRSLRAFERRLRRWSQHSRQSLKFFSDVENLHQLSLDRADPSLAALAQEAGYADQSHMGRAVRRATGFSPARLNRLIETEEAFWCYRLLGERF